MNRADLDNDGSDEDRQSPELHDYVTFVCEDGVTRLGKISRINREDSSANVDLYDCDLSDGLYKIRKHLAWTAPISLLGRVPRELLLYERAGRGFRCESRELAQFIINHRSPLHVPSLSKVASNKRKSMNGTSHQTTDHPDDDEDNETVSRRPHRSVRVPDRLSVSAVLGGTAGNGCDLEQQLQKAIKESLLEEAKRSKAVAHSGDQIEAPPVPQARPRKVINVKKRRADADVNPITKGIQKAETCTDYLGVAVLNDRFTASIVYRGQPRFLGLFDSSTEAAKAYDEMAFRMMGYKAETNFNVRENSVPVFGLGLKQAPATITHPRPAASTSTTTEPRRSSTSNEGKARNQSKQTWWFEEMIAKEKQTRVARTNTR